MSKSIHFRVPIGATQVRDYILPIATLLGFSVFVQVSEGGGMACLLLAYIFALISLIFGRRLPLPLRVFSSGVFLLLALGMCLSGRAMAPGLTAYTAQQALIGFALALPPLATLFRLWPERMARSIIVAAFPACFTLAALAAHIEERLFISRYSKTGVGPTARWTDSNSWLSYDAQTHRLDGSD